MELNGRILRDGGFCYGCKKRIKSRNSVIYAEIDIDTYQVMRLYQYHDEESDKLTNTPNYDLKKPEICRKGERHFAHTSIITQLQYGSYDTQFIFAGDTKENIELIQSLFKKRKKAAKQCEADMLHFYENQKTYGTLPPPKNRRITNFSKHIQNIMEENLSQSIEKLYRDSIRLTVPLNGL